MRCTMRPSDRCAVAVALGPELTFNNFSTKGNFEPIFAYAALGLNGRDFRMLNILARSGCPKATLRAWVGMPLLLRSGAGTLCKTFDATAG